jgi:5'-nucleotidase/UDP-sugar diphosphatase
MSHLVRTSAVLGAIALVIALPSGVAAKSKPKHTSTVRLVDALPAKTPKNLKRKCGKTRSAKKIRKRSTSRPTKNRIRTKTYYCDGGTRTVFTIKRPAAKTVTVPVPVPVPAAPLPATPSPSPTPSPTPTPTPTPTPEGPFQLTLLHNNDGESKYLVGDSIPNYGGITRFKTVLDRLRGEAEVADINHGTLTVSSGDNFLAGLNLRASFQRFDAGNGPFYDSDAIARLGYDAVTIGNHEFDFGPARLAHFIAFERSGVPFLSANTDMREEPLLQALRDNGRIADAVVVEESGEEIGIIGVSPPETPSISAPRRVKFAPDNAATAAKVNAVAQALTDEGVDKIILSSHLQNIANERAVVALLENVDIVISGGADDLLANDDDVLIGTPRPTPAGPYPTIATDSTGADVPIVTTQGEYRYVGRLTAIFDNQGRLISTDDARSGPVRVSADAADPDVAAEDPAIKTAITDPLVDYRAALAANIIGTSPVRLDGDNPNPIRLREANLGNLVADGFLAAANRTAAADGRPLAKVAFSNGGGIRNSIPAGEINEAQTFAVLPFDNVIVTVPNVPRDRFKALMEWGVAALPAANGKFPQISGFRLTVDTTKPAQVQTGSTITTPGQRITSLTLDDGTKIVENGAVVAGDPINIATTNFTANNGDAYPFTGLPAVAAGVPYQQALFDFIVQDLGGNVSGPAYQTGGNGRITITP